MAQNLNVRLNLSSHHVVFSGLKQQRFNQVTLMPLVTPLGWRFCVVHSLNWLPAPLHFFHLLSSGKGSIKSGLMVSSSSVGLRLHGSNQSHDITPITSYKVKQVTKTKPLSCSISSMFTHLLLQHLPLYSIFFCFSKALGSIASFQIFVVTQRW